MGVDYGELVERVPMSLTRVQIELPTDRVEALDRLAAEAGLATRKELVSNALTLLEWAVKQVRRGRVLASIDDEEGRMIELNMPFLSSLAEPKTKK